MLFIPFVAGKQFAPSISSQSHGDMLASQSANVIGRHHRGIAERFFERVRQELYGFLDLRVDEQFVILSSIMLCNDLRMLRFVEIIFGTSNRKRFDLARTCTELHRYDRR